MATKVRSRRRRGDNLDGSRAETALSRYYVPHGAAAAGDADIPRRRLADIQAGLRIGSYRTGGDGVWRGPEPGLRG